MHRRDSPFGPNAEWWNFKKVRIAALLRQGQGEANPRKAATRALSVALAGRIADGSLAETTLDIAAKIAAGGLEALPVVEGIVVAAMQKLDFQHRQNTAEPCMRGRGQSLSEVQMERLQDAAFTLSTHSSNQLLKVFGLAKSHKKARRLAEFRASLRTTGMRGRHSKVFVLPVAAPLSAATLALQLTLWQLATKT